jgi:aldehyde dehydrogenase (NAD+)
MLFSYENIEQALRWDHHCPYGLTASVFGGEEKAKRLASRLKVGSVIINDLIVPTADPRLPFGGVRESGFGVTRGVEGLLELTHPKVTSVRRGRWLVHLDTPKPRDSLILEGLLQWLHEGSWSKRMAGLRNIMRAVKTESKK